MKESPESQKTQGFSRGDFEGFHSFDFGLFSLWRLTVPSLKGGVEWNPGIKAKNELNLTLLY
jgi:hypothetical protein